MSYINTLKTAITYSIPAYFLYDAYVKVRGAPNNYFKRYQYGADISKRFPKDWMITHGVRNDIMYLNVTNDSYASFTLGTNIKIFSPFAYIGGSQLTLDKDSDAWKMMMKHEFSHLLHNDALWNSVINVMTTLACAILLSKKSDMHLLLP